MLKIGGNAETEFASANSININPVVHIEWNYNLIEKPYVVNTSSAAPLAAASILSDKSGWNIVDSGGQSISNDYNNLGISCDTNPDDKTVYFYGKNTYAEYASDAINVTPAKNSYYKAVFYVKSGDVTNYTQLNAIPRNQIILTPETPYTSGSPVTYYYRLAPVGPDGQVAPPDPYLADVQSVQVQRTGNGYIDVGIDYVGNKKYAAGSYHVLRGTSPGNLSYVTTVKFNPKLVNDASLTGSIGTFYYDDVSDFFLGQKFVLNNPSGKRGGGQSVRSTWVVTAIDTVNLIVTASVVSSTGTIRLPQAPGERTRGGKTNTYAITYRDKLSTPLKRLAPVIKTTNSTLIPEVTLQTSGTYLETTRSFLKVYETPNSEPTYNKGSVELDSIGFKKIEILFGSTEAFNTIRFNFNVVSQNAGSRMVLYRPQIFKITSWEFYTSPYYPVESCFEGFRPGEALLNPYLQSDDKLINKHKLGLSGATFAKPSSLMVFSPDALYNSLRPYKQMYNSLTDTNLKYYVSDKLDVLTDPKDGNSGQKISIRAQYNNYMSINKIVIKGSNCLTDIRLSTGNVKLLIGDGSTVTIPYGAGDFNASGILTLYYDGAVWSTTKPSLNYPPALSDSGVLINVLPEVTGIIFNMNTLSWSNKTLIESGDYDSNRRAHIFEISPRLEIDVSGLTKSVNVNKQLDNGNSAGFPLGISNANSADITLSNIPVTLNSFPHTIFDHYSDSSTFAGMLKKNCKFTVCLVSGLNSFYEYIPFFTMYSEEWNVSGFEVSINLFDASKTILMSKQAPDYFGEFESMFETITTILDVSGFSDYDYDGLRVLLKNRATKTTHFWCDKSKQSLFEALQGYLAAHQISAYIDEYGILRFIDLEKIVKDYYDETLSPDFAVTDKELTLLNSEGQEIRYIANIMNDSYSENVTPQVGKVSVSYQIPTINYSGDKSDSFLTGTQSAAEVGVWSSKTTTGLARTTADVSVKYNAESMFISPSKFLDPNKGLDSQKGTFFLQGELVSYEGLSYKFTPIQNNVVLTVRSKLPYPNKSLAFNAIIRSGSDLTEITQDLMNQDPSITTVKYDFTGKIHGLARGQRFTSVRNHKMFDETGRDSLNGYENPAGNFREQWIDSAGNFQNSLIVGGKSIKPNILFHKNIATFTVGNQTRPIVLYPIASTDSGEKTVPTSASNFNTFSTVFRAPDPKFNKQVALGIFVDTNYGPLLFRLLNAGKTTKLLRKLNTSNTIKLSSIDQKGNPVSTKATGFYTKNVFDGKPHRLTVIFHNENNRNTVNIPGGALSYCTVYVDDRRYGTFIVDGARNIKLQAKWGCWAGNNSTALNFPKGTTTAKQQLESLKSAAKVDFYELYGVNWFEGNGVEIDNRRVKHHWESSEFLRKIMNKDPEAEPKYYFWGPLYLTGAQFIENESFNTNPISIKTVRSEYGGYNPHYTAGTRSKLRVARSDSIGFSRINASPFRFSQAAVNRDNGAIFLSVTDGKIGDGVIFPYTVRAFYSKLSDAKQLERVVDAANLSQSINIESPWVQTERDAEILLDRIALFASSFNSEVNVSIYGNPLVQLGDFCQLVYSLKKIGYDPNSPTGGLDENVKTFLVKGISHDFSNGLKTQLTLKPMFQLPQ